MHKSDDNTSTAKARNSVPPAGVPVTLARWSPKRLLWLSLGLICVVLGAIGAFLPLLPTTSFLLLAAFSFARSSPRLYNWLLSHRAFGPLIRNWQEHKAISRRSKVMCAISMIAILGLSVALGAPRYVIALQGVILGAVAAFVLSRPVPPKL